MRSQPRGRVSNRPYRRVAAAILACAAMMAGPALHSSAQAATVTLSPGANIQAAVNINPNGDVPHVDVIRMPELHLTPEGCQNGQNYQTGIGRSVMGPLMVSYLHLPPQTTATLNDRNGSHSMNLSQAGQITTAIFLEPGQTLSFDSDVMYSGCRP